MFSVKMEISGPSTSQINQQPSKYGKSPEHVSEAPPAAGQLQVGQVEQDFIANTPEQFDISGHSPRIRVDSRVVCKNAV